MGRRQYSAIALATALCLTWGVGLVSGGPRTSPVVDTLGAAPPDVSFSAFGSGGVSILPEQLVGPEFVLTERTQVREIGAFVNGPRAILVQIRPSANGVPDASKVLATLTLSDDQTTSNISFESVGLHLTLPAGRYFALFAPQGEDADCYLLNRAQSPFTYDAGMTLMGFLNPTTGTASSTEQFGAVRILIKDTAKSH